MKLKLSDCVVVGLLMYIGSGIVPGILFDLQDSSPNPTQSQKADPINFSDSQQAQFIKRLYGPALQMQRKHGIPAELAIAIAALESGWGKHKKGKGNYWGLKARDGQPFVESQTTEFINGEKVTVNAKFLDGTIEECLEEFATRIKGYTRKDGLEDEIWLENFAIALKSLYRYYATDPQYQAKLERILKEVNDEIQQARSQRLQGIKVNKTIILAAGHTIWPCGYPGGKRCENGAKNEMRINKDITTVLEKKLKASGWKVVRPDHNPKQFANWEDYVNWAERQVKDGAVWVEIHGQPFIPYPDTRPNVRWPLGTICNLKDIFCAQLSKKESIGRIGGLDYWNYSVSNNLGIIAEVQHPDLFPKDKDAQIAFIEESAERTYRGLMEGARLEDQLSKRLKGRK